MRMCMCGTQRPLCQQSARARAAPHFFGKWRHLAASCQCTYIPLSLHAPDTRASASGSNGATAAPPPHLVQIGRTSLLDTRLLRRGGRSPCDAVLFPPCQASAPGGLLSTRRATSGGSWASGASSDTERRGVRKGSSPTAGAADGRGAARDGGARRSSEFSRLLARAAPTRQRHLSQGPLQSATKPRRDAGPPGRRRGMAGEWGPTSAPRPGSARSGPAL